MSDGDIWEHIASLRSLERMGFDLTGFCQLPDCGCDGNEHE